MVVQSQMKGTAFRPYGFRGCVSAGRKKLRQKANALNNRGRSDDSVLRISWVGFWELSRTNSYLPSDGENLHTGSTFLHNGIDAYIDIDSLVHDQPCNFRRLIAE
jgi:hypothetical protein